MLRDYESCVLKIVQRTHDTKSFFVRVPPDFEFKPGQFIMLKLEIDEKRGFKLLPGTNKVQARAYTIASAPDHKGYIELIIKKKENGFVSVYLNEFVQEGDKVFITGPFGKAYFEDDMNDIVLLSAGCGVSMSLSILRYIVGKKLRTHATLFYSARTPEDIICAHELKRLNELSNIEIIITLTRLKPEHRWQGPRGRIDAKLLNMRLKNLKSKIFFICGMPTFVQAMGELLVSLGVSPDAIKSEHWHERKD